MRLMLASVTVLGIAIAVVAWYKLKPSGPGAGFVSGNGRVEATEIDVATKLAGRVEAILVNEGDFVRADQLLAKMGTEVLVAQRDEARAQSRQAAIRASAQSPGTSPEVTTSPLNPAKRVSGVFR